jgi:Cys-tRNA(Pro)/Cys-tRNA(Cys) deacylase
VTPAVRAVRAAGIAFRVLEIDPDAAPSTAVEAAAALGVPPESLFKTLIAKVDGARLVVALVPVVCDLDLEALAR